MDILVSVVVLTYNQEGTIAQTLDSIISQRVEFPIEIIIGEDASPSDNTREICDQYAEKFPNVVRVLPQAPNKGLLVNYRDAIKECRGKYIAICSGDDFWSGKDSLATKVNFLENNPDYGMVHTDYDVLYMESGSVLECFNRRKNIEIVSGGIECFEQLLKRNLIGALTVVMSRDIFNSCVDVDVFIEQGFLMEDYPVWLSMSRHAKIKYLDFSSATYRHAVGSISNNQNDYSKQRSFSVNVAKIKLFYLNLYGGNPSIVNHINKYLYRDLVKYSKENGEVSEYIRYKLLLIRCRVNMLCNKLFNF